MPTPIGEIAHVFDYVARASRGRPHRNELDIVVHPSKVIEPQQFFALQDKVLNLTVLFNSEFYKQDGIQKGEFWQTFLRSFGFAISDGTRSFC